MIRRIPLNPFVWAGLAFLALLTLAAILALGVSWTRAADPGALQGGAPSLVSYQGSLTGNAGAPLNETVTLEFRLYDSASGGNLLWQETHAGVMVSAGFFSIHLGESTPLTAAHFDEAGRYLEVRVDRGAGFVTLGSSPCPRRADSRRTRTVTDAHRPATRRSGAQRGGPAGPQGSHRPGRVAGRRVHDA